MFLMAVLLTFSRDVSPILRRHCVRCHGQDGVSSNGLDLRSYNSLMRGGNIGGDVVPGKPEQSVLVHMVEGRRGPEHRMPLHRKPLTPNQLALIRDWIQAGARK